MISEVKVLPLFSLSEIAAREVVVVRAPRPGAVEAALPRLMVEGAIAQWVTTLLTSPIARAGLRKFYPPVRKSCM